MNEAFKDTSAHEGHLVLHSINKKWYFVIVEEHNISIKILGERRIRGRIWAEHSDPKRTTGSFRCMVSTERFTQPTSFIRQTLFHISLGFHGRFSSAERTNLRRSAIFLSAFFQFLGILACPVQ